MDKNVETRLTAQQKREALREALRIAKYVHKYISPAPYHKDDMPFRIILDAAKWYKQLTDGRFEQLIEEVDLLFIEEQEQPEPAIPEPGSTPLHPGTPMPTDHPTEIGAGNMRGILYRLMEEQQGHTIELDIPETTKEPGKIRKATLQWYGGIDEAYATISNFTKWLFDRL